MFAQGAVLGRAKPCKMRSEKRMEFRNRVSARYAWQTARPMRGRCTILAIATAAALALPAAAEAAADIEGVWAVNGGQVAVQAAADGTFTGTVVRPVAFSDCAHPVGEQLWTGVVAQPGGFYRGAHQWFAAGCRATNGRGATAYRVLARPDGSHLLRVCFADPASTEFAPAIAPHGIATSIERPCVDFDAVALPATAPTLSDIADLPSTKRCRTSRSLKIGLREPAGDALASVIVTVDGRRLPTQDGAAATAPIALTGLPEGRYTVKVHATTVLGRIIAGKRLYRACAGGGGAPGRAPSGRPRNRAQWQH